LRGSGRPGLEKCNPVPDAHFRLTTRAAGVAADIACQGATSDGLVVQRLASTLLILALVVGAGAFARVRAAQENAWASAPKILAAANAWREGQPIPPDLRVYREPLGDMPSPNDSGVLISGITNVQLLATLATDLEADPRSREDAYVQGLYVGGPTRFFAVLGRCLSMQKQTVSPWLVELKRRAAQPHIVVNALFIDDADMPREQALRVLDTIERELRGGSAWGAVYRKYSDKFGYETSNRTKIGNLGDLVVYPDPDLGRGYYVDIAPHTITWRGEELPRRLSRLGFFDAAHLPAIMSASVGDVIRLHSSLYNQFVLYQVEEVYSGAR
jgi:hypothetical protein